MRWKLLVVMTLGAAVFGQGFGAGYGPRAQAPRQRMARVAGMRSMDSLKAALSLSDVQVQQLRDLRREQFQAARPSLEQMREKRRTLGELMRSENPDPGQVGQLMVESKKLRDSVKTAGADYRAKAQSLLTPDQKTKLMEMEKAGRSGAMRQAAAAGLLAPPERRAGRMGRQSYR
ncbi:MAG: periplasmic heavy metal sensor [Acidobacteria bacterium]|nr:periplasmic heavy metal sensor [Acidobacteriota bacterium]